MNHHTITLALLGVGVAAAITPAGALAQPMRDAGIPAAAGHRHHHPVATYPSITFTNPLGRSRGPGAGAGQL